jgi:hypothetical protein
VTAWRGPRRWSGCSATSSGPTSRYSTTSLWSPRGGGWWPGKRRRPCAHRRWREDRLCDGGGGQVRDDSGATPSILDVEAQPAAAQILLRQRPIPAATQRWRTWIWARRRPPSSTATATAGVSARPGSRLDGPRSGLDCFFIFKNIFFVSFGNDQYYKPFIFYIVQIVSVTVADTKYRFSTDTINTFCCSEGYLQMKQTSVALQQE